MVIKETPRVQRSISAAYAAEGPCGRPMLYTRCEKRRVGINSGSTDRAKILHAHNYPRRKESKRRKQPSNAIVHRNQDADWKDMTNRQISFPGRRRARTRERRPTNESSRRPKRGEGIGEPKSTAGDPKDGVKDCKDDRSRKSAEPRKPVGPARGHANENE